MARALVILLALTIDLIWGDPPNQLHPVAWIGRWLSWGQRLAPQHHRFWFGASWTLAGALLFTLPWWKVEGKKQSILHPSSFILHPFLLKPVFAYRNLRQGVISVAEALALTNLSEARRLLSWHLVSRNTSDLTEPEVVGAAIESLAENLTDSLAAPLLAYAGGGLCVAWAYRFINTADAMWGYRTLEFEQLGKFPARFDDVLNWLPARLTGWLLVIAAWLVGENTRGAVRTMLAQRQRTASPNAGWTMSAMAGALGVTLSKRGVYDLEGGQGQLNTITIKRALRLGDACTGLIVVLSVLVAILIQGKIRKS